MQPHYVLFGIIAGLLLCGLVSRFASVRLWIAGKTAGAPVSLLSLVAMRMRGIDPQEIVEMLIVAHKAGLAISPAMLEAHFLAGGRVRKVVHAMIVAKKANLPLTWETATAIDLSGEDVEAVVRAKLPPQPSAVEAFLKAV